MRDELPGIGAVLARMLPARVVERMFTPAYLDLYDEHAAEPRSIRARLAFAIRAVMMALECATRAAAERRHRQPDPAGTGRGVDPMLVQDLRFAMRMLWKDRTFTLVAVLALAIGIGANTAIFSIVQAVLLEPLPYADPARIMNLTEVKAGRQTTVSPPNFLDWARQNQTFERVAAYNDATLTLSGGVEPERLDAAMAGSDLFDVLGVRPMLGRGFLAAEALPGGARAVVLGHGLWQRRFGSDPGIVGRTITVDSAPHVVVGVMPPGFTFPGDVDLWVPLVLTERDTGANQRGAHYLSAVGRLRPGITVDQARADLDRIEQAIAVVFPSKVGGYSISVEPLLDSIVGDVRRPLWMLLGAVLFVLLIACVNVSNLLLARATTRRSEIAIRTALGASRWRIVRQLLAESVLLALAAGLVGIVLAAWAVRALATVLPPDLPRTAAIGVDGRVLFFSVVVSLVTGVVFGLAPALYASTPDLAAFLKDARRDGSASGGRRGVRSLLVAVEVALALVLLAGAGLTIRSFERLSAVHPGFDGSGVLSANVALPEARYPDGAAVVRFYQEFLERVSAQPGVTAAGAVMMPPLSPNGGFGGSFSIIGRTPEEAGESMQVRPATPGYFEALRIPLIRGRLITAADRDGSLRVAVISDDAARKFWPGEDPIGQRIRIHVGIYGTDTQREIVGVVGNVKTGSLAADARPVVYVPHAQYPSDVMTLFVRGTGEAMTLLPALKGPLGQLDREVALTKVRPVASLVSASVAAPRFRMLLLGLFAAIALVLAAVGLYGVMAFSVTQRKTEMGLRIALGADAGAVLRLVLIQGLIPVAAGIACGLGGALGLTRLMSGLLYDVKPFDPLTFGAVAAILAAVAVIACYLPARRAMAVDPMIAMRNE